MCSYFITSSADGRMFVPAAGVSGGIERDATGSPRDFSRLPLLPLWPGFAINVAFYATLSWLLAFAPSTIRRIIRARRNRCPTCAYDTRGLDTCPECGADA
jgi:hypothetical protein